MPGQGVGPHFLCQGYWHRCHLLSSEHRVNIPEGVQILWDQVKILKFIYFVQDAEIELYKHLTYNLE